MAKNDDFLKKLQQTDPAVLRALLQRATRTLTPDQQKRLQALMGDPQRLEQLKGQLQGKELAGLGEHLTDPDTLEQYLRRGDIQKRIDELL